MPSVVSSPGAMALRRMPGRLQNLVAFLLSYGCGLAHRRDDRHGRRAEAGDGGNFYELRKRKWGDAQWRAARVAIETQNARDEPAGISSRKSKASRSTATIAVGVSGSLGCGAVGIQGDQALLNGASFFHEA